MLKRILEPEVMESLQDAIEYDAMDFAEVNTAFAERALELGPPAGIVLDAGTGTARIPILILQRNQNLSVIGVDYSRNMLKVGEKNVLQAGFEARITLQWGDAKNLPFPDGAFDLVMSNSLAHHLPDPLPFFREIRRLANHDAGILIRDLIRPESADRLDELVEFYAADANDHQKKLFRDSLHAALSLDEVAAFLRQADLCGVQLVQSSDRHWSVERKSTRHA